MLLKFCQKVNSFISSPTFEYHKRHKRKLLIKHNRSVVKKYYHRQFKQYGNQILFFIKYVFDSLSSLTTYKTYLDLIRQKGQGFIKVSFA